MNYKLQLFHSTYDKLLDYFKGFTDEVNSYRDGNKVIIQCDRKIYNKQLLSDLITTGWYINADNKWVYEL